MPDILHMLTGYIASPEILLLLAGSIAMPDELFWCAGNKEAEVAGEYKAPQAPPANSPFERCQKSRRFQIYVHSKMLIADDEVMIGCSVCPPSVAPVQKFA